MGKYFDDLYRDALYITNAKGNARACNGSCKLKKAVLSFEPPVQVRARRRPVVDFLFVR